MEWDLTSFFTNLSSAVDKPKNLSKIYPQLQAVLVSLHDTGKVPTNLKISPDDFSVAIVKKFLARLIVKGDVSESNREAYINTLFLFIENSTISYPRSFLFIHAIFGKSKNKLANHILVELHRRFVQAPIYQELIDYLSTEDSNTDEICILLDSMLPSPDIDRIKPPFMRQLNYLLENDFKNTNGSMLLYILYKVNASDDEYIDLIHKCLTSHQFEKELSALDYLVRLIDKPVAINYIRENINYFITMQFHAEYYKLIYIIFEVAAKKDFISDEQLAQLWNLHSIQHFSEISLFFKIFIHIFRAIHQNHFDHITQLVLKPQDKSKEWLEFIHNIILELENRDECKKIIDTIKSAITKLAKEKSPIQQLAKQYTQELQAVCVDKKSFNHLIDEFIKKPNHPSLVIELLKRQELSDKKKGSLIIAACVKQLTPEMTLDQVNNYYVLIYQLVSYYHIPLEEKLLYNLAERKVHSVYSLIQRLIDEGILSESSFAEFTRRCTINAICEQFYPIASHLIDWTSIDCLPFEEEDIGWKFAISDTHLRERFGTLLCKVYSRNKSDKVSDEAMIKYFVKSWETKFDSSKNKMFCIELLAKFVHVIEYPIFTQYKRHKPAPLKVLRISKQDFSIEEDMSVTALLQYVCDEFDCDYTSYSLKYGQNILTNKDKLSDLKEIDGKISIKLVQKDSKRIRERKFLPSQHIVESSAFPKIFKYFANDEVHKFINKLPTRRDVIEQLKSIHQPEFDLKSFFPINDVSAFLYNLEAYESEGNTLKITGNVFSYLVKNGLNLGNSDISKIVLNFMDIGTSLIPKKDSFDELMKYITSSDENLEDALILLTRVYEPSFTIESTDQFVLKLLNNSDSEVRKAAVEFLKPLPISYDIYNNSKEDNSSMEFFTSMSHHLQGNDPEFAQFLVKHIKNYETSIECLIYYAEHEYFTSEQLSAISTTINLRFFIPNANQRNSFKDISRLVALLITKETEKHFDELLQYDTFSSWSIDGDSLLVNEGGFVGLKNLGCTCYLNSVLQQLFAIDEFRTLVLSYRGNDAFTKELTKLFTKLRYSDKQGKSTRKLASTWINPDRTRLDPSDQQDANDFLLNLFDKIETPLSKEKVEGIFLGKFENIIQRLDNDKIVSSTMENFYMIPLTIINVNGFNDSLEKFGAPDFFIGENGYKVDDETVDAKKFCRIAELPSHLIIQLKRFEYDFATWQRYKVKDLFAFPFEMTMNNQHFNLRGVICHRGTAEYGHYYSYVKFGNQWKCFNDSDVGNVTENEIIASQKSAAYILFYERDDVKHTKKPREYDQKFVDQALLKIQKDKNKKYNIQRIICSSHFFAIINGWSKSKSVPHIRLSIRYLFVTLPFTAIVTGAHELADNLINNLEGNEQLFIETIIKIPLTNCTVGCPTKEIREATCKVLSKLIKQTRNDAILEKVIKIFNEDVTTFYNHFDELVQIIYENTDMIKSASFIEKFFMHNVYQIVKYQTDVIYSQMDLTHSFLVLSKVKCSPAFKGFALDQSWIKLAIKSHSDLNALATLLLSLDSHEHIVQILESDPSGFGKLIQILPS